MPYNPKIHHRRSIRLDGYDYTQAGAYFVTICVQRRECLFGEVTRGQLQMNEYGLIVREAWEWLAKQYDYVDLDASIVMPNHFHGIIVLADNSFSKGSSPVVPATTDAPQRKSLGRLIGAYKTTSTKQINILRDTPGATVWQRNYYEHIIRSDLALQRIRDYIANNAYTWLSDTLNSDQ
jgi:putative transposase